jgi:hypothetical protein
MEDSLDHYKLDETFREEGISVGFSGFRIEGEPIEMSISPVCHL